MVNRQSAWKKALIYALLITICVVTLLPLVWMLSASLKLDKDVFKIPVEWIPSNPAWSNYKRIWEQVPFLTFTLNTFKITVITTIIQVITSSFAAYGFAKCEFKGRNLLFMIYVATIAVPWQVYMLPQYSMMNAAHLVDSHLSLILLHAFDAFGVFLLRQFCMGIPNELLEAARIDGLSEYGIYGRIVLPQMGPSIASLVIFTFVTNWNDFMGPMIYLNSTGQKTIQLGIRMFMGQYSTEYGLIMAASVVSLIPVVIVFLIFQKSFVQGVATSGLKG
ncbi:MAG TPA: carbohydrate ABC transporter permease [Pseudoflavonifractor sp.]|jgi:multiple sugar transport system permease protein|nr:carbohydrate ABC transporter permease [Pseudoflavonifractor sp.]